MVTRPTFTPVGGKTNTLHTLTLQPPAAAGDLVALMQGGCTGAPYLQVQECQHSSAEPCTALPLAVHHYITASCITTHHWMAHCTSLHVTAVYIASPSMTLTMPEFTCNVLSTCNGIWLACHIAAMMPGRYPALPWHHGITASYSPSSPARVRPSRCLPGH